MPAGLTSRYGLSRTRWPRADALGGHRPGGHRAGSPTRRRGRGASLRPARSRERGPLHDGDDLSARLDFQADRDDRGDDPRQRGEARTERPGRAYLPAFKDQKFKTPAGDLVHRPFTIRHLLTHTSGLPSNSPLRELPVRQWLGLPLSETVDAVAKVDLIYEPGTKSRYSTVGFATLGRVVEVVSGRPFEQFVTQRIFEPAGDASFVYRQPRPLSDQVAPGFFFRLKDGKYDGTDAHDPNFKIVNTMPNAGVFTTANDLAIFYQTFLNGGTWRPPGAISRVGPDDARRPDGRSAGPMGPWLEPRVGPAGHGRVRLSGENIQSHRVGAVLAWGDPVEGVIGIALMQGEHGAVPLHEVWEHFQHMVYAALDDAQKVAQIDRPSQPACRAEGPKCAWEVRTSAKRPSWKWASLSSVGSGRLRCTITWSRSERASICTRS